MMTTTITIDSIRKEMNRKHTCCICHKVFRGYGNNPQPLVMRKGSRCCDDCDKLVIETRKKLIYSSWLLDQLLQEQK